MVRTVLTRVLGHFDLLLALSEEEALETVWVRVSADGHPGGFAVGVAWWTGAASTLAVDVGVWTIRHCGASDGQ
jgi:hypothetical protein